MVNKAVKKIVELHCMCWPLGTDVNDTGIKSENLYEFNIEEVRFS